MVAMGALFLFSAAVQWNDPDPVRWMAIYLAAASVELASAWRRLPWPIPLGVGAIAAAWAVVWAAGIDWGTVGPVFSRFGMMSPAVEEVREMTGLLLVVVGMAIVVVSRRTESGRAPEPVGAPTTRP